MSDTKNSLESYVVELLKDVDPLARRTKNSGGSTEPYDISTKLPFAFECKQKRTNKHAVINRGVWQKLCSSIPLNSDRLPVLVIENQDGNRFAVLHLEDFMYIAKAYWRSLWEENQK